MDVKNAVAEYVDWFNHRRLHGELWLVPPADFEPTSWASQSGEHYRKTELDRRIKYAARFRSRWSWSTSTPTVTGSWRAARSVLSRSVRT